MPKATDPNCPLGFHPQFRRPNYCKRCFRDYSEHKTKELSGSTTSINSLSQYDPNTNSFTKRPPSKEEDSTSQLGSRDSLVASTRLKDEDEGKKSSLSRSYSEDKGGEGVRGSTAPTSPFKPGQTWGKSRPMSWSAQDLRQAVTDAKESVYTSKEDLFSSTKSLDKDVGYESKSSSTSSTDKKDSSEPTYSFSSYLRTKSPARPPLLRTSSDSLRKSLIAEDTEHEEDAPPSRQSRLSTLSETGTKKSSLPTIGEGSKPPRAPTRYKERSQSAKLPEIQETSDSSFLKPKTILSLKKYDSSTTEKNKAKEVKSTDEEADVSYVIKLKPKPKKVEIDLNSEVERLQRDNKRQEKDMKDMAEKYSRLEENYKEATSKKPKFGKTNDVTKLQQKIDELNDDNKVRQKEVKELKKEIDKRPLPKDVDKTIQDLRSKLAAAEQLCEELMDENEDYKKEVKCMEDEIEEMQDNFREDQADEYRDLKRELEQRAKDCRVLQFKLKKSERRADYLERDKAEAEEKLSELQLGDQDMLRVDRINNLERELSLAKEVSLKMHEEMEKTKRELEVAEVDKKKLKEKVADTPTRTTNGRYSRSSLIGSRQNSQDNSDQVMRDLQATQEREQDLKEQLKFAEEEAKGMRKKMSRMEDENETLQMQLNKMSAKAKVNRQRSLERSGSLERSSSVERGTLSRQGSLEKQQKSTSPDEMDPTEMKIQLELNEQESAVLRRKLDQAEMENERLQREIKDVLAMKSNNSGSSNSELSDLRRKLESLQKDLSNYKTKSEELTQENDNLSDENKKLQIKSQKRLPLTSQENVYVENQVLQDKVGRLEKRNKEANLKLKSAESVTNLSNGAGESEVGELKKRIAQLESGSALDVQKLLSNRVSKVPKDTTPKNTLIKWVNDLETECGHLQSALKEAEKKKPRSSSSDRDNLRDVKDLLQKEKEKVEEMTHQLKEERLKGGKDSSLDRRLGNRAEDLRRYEEKVERLTRELEQEKQRNNRKTLSTEESKLSKEKQRTQDLLDSKTKDAEETKKLRMSHDRLQRDVDDLKDTITRLEREKDRMGSKVNREVENLKGEKGDLQTKVNTLENDLKVEKSKREKAEKESSSRLYNRSASGELSEVQKKLTKSEQEVKKLTTDLEGARSSLNTKLKDLEKAKKKEHDELVDLQVKYDLLEEDFVLQKAQYSSKRDTNVEDYQGLKKEYDTIETELKKLRETYNLRQDTWIKEKLTMQEQVKDLEIRLGRAAGDGGSFIEKNRLKDILEDKNLQIEKLKKDEEILRDQLSYFRREGEELRRKVDDLEKLNDLNDRRQITTSTDTSAFETTIKELKTKLSTNEKTMKAETTKIKMKYDSKIKMLADEVSTLSTHMSKYKRERDTYRDMLETKNKNSQKAAGPNYRTSRADNATEMANFETQRLDFQSQITELEDKLADTKIENTKLKNNLVDIKTNTDIQMCEMQTKLNEYEEDRLLGGGSRKVPGLRTRLELTWQKEREEQQRLITEASTLAKDLRNTLYEVERERDLEKLEAKRKVEQLKRSVNVDHQDTIGKVQELQRDLQELREAHAKLRQINEKLRREKDRTEVEREAMRDKYLGSSRETLNQQAKFERITDEMRRVRDLAPFILGEVIDGRDSSISNLSSAGDPKPKTKEDFTDALKKLVRGMDDLKVLMGGFDDRDRFRRAGSLRRALSMESNDDDSTTGSLRARSVGGRGGLHKHHLMPKHQKNTLYRKAQSLDHQMAEDRGGKIWVSTDAGSTSSIDSAMTDDLRRARDMSMDRISGGSQTSMLEGDRKTKGLRGMFSKIKKSISIEDSNTGGSIKDAGVKAMGVSIGSTGSDLPGEVEKDSVKNKLKTLFRGNKTTTGGSSSRSASTERDNKVKKAASTLESDKPSSISSTSLGKSSADLPPVLRRIQGGRATPFGPTITKSRPVSRQPSTETQV